jgi:hypothetical protein
MSLDIVILLRFSEYLYIIVMTVEKWFIYTCSDKFHILLIRKAHNQFHFFAITRTVWKVPLTFDLHNFRTVSHIILVQFLI